MLLTKGLYKIKLQGAYRYILVWLLFVFSVPVSAQTEQRVDSVATPFRDRVAVHTNTTDWLLLTPNIGVEYSFIQNDFNKLSFLLHGKYNPNSSIRFNPNYIYNIAGARAEVRWYYRTRKISENERRLNSMDNWWKRALRRPYSFFAKENPRRHRAYYVGPYISFDKYTIKLGDTGYQGHAYGFGITAGYSVPLYKYRNGHAIDFEIGASVGVAMSEHDKFELDSDGMCYAFSGHKNMHVVPFPVVSDVHVAFVYRLKSIGDQIREVDWKKVQQDSIIYKYRKSYNSDNFKYISSDNVPADTIKAWNKIIREKNREIKEINKRAIKYAEVDSSMLLQELGYYYSYISVPEKLFAKKYLKEYPHNSEISSLDEINGEITGNAFIKELLAEYKNIKDEIGILSLETAVVKEYQFHNVTDEKIQLMSFISKLIPRINSESIEPYNRIYHTGGEVEQSTVLPINSKVIVYSKDNTRLATIQTNFAEGIDTVYLKKDKIATTSLLGKNAEIEATNLVKYARLEKIIGNSVPETVAEKPKEKKKSKRKWWPFKKEKVGEVVPVDTLKGIVPLQMDSLKRHDSIMPDSIVAPIDTLRENVIGDVVLKNSSRRAFIGYPLYTKQ